MELFGSFQNRVWENSASATPEVGMGATEMCYSDRRAYEVVAIKDERHITVRRMARKCIDYFAGDWEVSPDPNGITVDLFLTQKKQWRARHGRKLGCNVFVLGHADEYEDPSF